MNLIKRTVSIVCTLAMIFSFVIIATAENAMKITASSIDKSIKTEQEVKINISNNTGIVGFKLHFEYDPDEVEIISSSAGQVTSRGSYIDNIGSKSGKFDILWNNTTNVSGDGTIVILKVRLLNSSNAVIHVSYSQADTCSFSESTGKFSDVTFNCSDIVTKDTEVSTTAKSAKENVSNQIEEIKEDEEKSSDNRKKAEAKSNEAITDKKGYVEVDVGTDVTTKEETGEAKDKSNNVKKGDHPKTIANSTNKTDKSKATDNAKDGKRQIKKVDVIIASIVIIAAFVVALIITKKRNS